MKTSGTIVLTAILLMGLLPPAQAQLPLPLPAVEQNQLDRTAPQRPRTNAPAVRINERQAVNIARQRFPGTVLRIGLIGEGVNRRYQIRMENEGKVFTVFVHATTGQVTGSN